jgi:hypothetical protein
MINTDEQLRAMQDSMAEKGSADKKLAEEHQQSNEVTREIISTTGIY